MLPEDEGDEAASTRDHRARLENAILLFQQIFFVIVRIHPGTPRVPPRVLASGPKPCGGKKYSKKEKAVLQYFEKPFKYAVCLYFCKIRRKGVHRVLSTPACLGKVPLCQVWEEL